MFFGHIGSAQQKKVNLNWAQYYLISLQNAFLSATINTTYTIKLKKQSSIYNERETKCRNQNETYHRKK
jgi:hypothetical protein